MYTKQKRVMDAFVRVRSFLEAGPATRALRRAEARRQSDQIALIFDRHMRPIVTIARAQVEPESDVGLPASLRMPVQPLGPTKVLVACDGMIESARRFEALFIANGLPADFLAQFVSARDALERVMGGRATQIGTHVATRVGLRVQLLRRRNVGATQSQRSRNAVDRLDAIVRVSFRPARAVSSDMGRVGRRSPPDGGN